MCRDTNLIFVESVIKNDEASHYEASFLHEIRLKTGCQSLPDRNLKYPGWKISQIIWLKKSDFFIYLI